MNTNSLYHDIIDLISKVRNNEEKLMEIFTLLENQYLKDNREENEPGLPEEYKDIVRQIARAVNEGFICYLNPDTHEIEQLPESTVFEPDEYSEQNDDMVDEFGMNYMKWERYIKIEPMDRNDIFLVMETFTTSLKDRDLSQRLENVLGGENAVSRFNHIIENSGEYEAWLNYKRVATENYVKNIITGRL